MTQPVAPEDRHARMALNWLTEPGDPRVASLVTDLGAVRVHQHLLAERDLEGLHTDVALRLEQFDSDAHLAEVERIGARFVVPGDEEWPSGLDGLSEAGTLNERGGVPLGLWVRGPIRMSTLAGAVAVVGSRSATTYGQQIAAEIGNTLAQAGRAVVSGAALGIDHAAHRGALSGGGPSVAVLACGVDRVYPAANRALVEHMLAVGAVVSETAPGREPTRIRFLSRNRIIAALTGSTVVVEAALRSGALSTATWCERLNRTLLGVPGPVTSAASQGVHERIRLGRAQLVTGGEDVLELIGSAGEHMVEPRRGKASERDRLPWRQRQVLEAFVAGQVSDAEELAREAAVGLREVQGALLRLGSQGWVRRQGEGWTLASGP